MHAEVRLVPQHPRTATSRVKWLVGLIYQRRWSGLKPLTRSEYHCRLVADPGRAREAFDKAWAIRNFEIELYWKRATYFWAFVASTLVGYFALVNADGYREPDPYKHVEVYLVVCIGLLLSLAWYLTNRGS